MNFDTVVEHRRSVRSFADKHVSWKRVLDAIDCALQGQFAGNSNNLKFLIIEEKKTIVDVARLCEQAWVANAQILVLVLADESHPENVYGERGRVYSRQQAGAAISTMIFKLVDMGLGACWVGSYNDERLKNRLKIPEHIQIEVVVPIGYPEKKEPKSTKKELEHALFWEQWGGIRRPSLFEEDLSDLTLAPA